MPAPGSPIVADRRRLRAWFAPRRRAYPWRSQGTDAYRVLVSEVMLQQTQAPRVAPIYEAFVGRFPDVASLAGAGRGDVVRAWAGLGYHRRAVALHEAAKAIVERHSGVVPRDRHALRALPGVGPYTASAVASIAYGETVAAVDTNVRRITARYLFGREPDELPTRDVTEAADGWIDGARAGEWNQALMDLGREICRPHPRCTSCPLHGCRFRAVGRTGRSSARRQAPFEGSSRQARGRVLGFLREGGVATEGSLASRLDLPSDRVAAAVAGLIADGLAEPTSGGRVRLAP